MNKAGGQLGTVGFEAVAVFFLSFAVCAALPTESTNTE